MVTEHNELGVVLANIELKPFKHSYLNMLHEILSLQEYPDFRSVTAKTLPKTGFIAMLGDQPIAVGFLRRVECDIVAQLDGLASNPAFGSVIRHQAISMVVDRLILEAKQLKLQGIIAFTEHGSIIERAADIGFLKINHTLLSLTF